MASAKHLPINIDKEKIAVFCRTHGIGRLSLFGSVLRDDFDPVRSDVDVLAAFVAFLHAPLLVLRWPLQSYREPNW